MAPNVTPPEAEAAAYRAFLEAKVDFAARAAGHAPLPPEAVHPSCKPHQVDIIRRGVEAGRCAYFLSFGLGKGTIQQESVRLACARIDAAAAAGTGATRSGGRARGLIVAPLGVRGEFRRDAERLGIQLVFLRTTAELEAHEAERASAVNPPPRLYLTNYESVRDGRLDVSTFDAVSLDEAAVLRGFGGTKTFREFMRLFAETPCRFVATATPSPNEYLELVSYAAYLGVMDVGEAKTRFFKRDSEKADQLTLHPHKVEEFWVWVHAWAVFLERPSDLGYDDAGYALPPLTVNWHQIDAPLLEAGADKFGRYRLGRDVAKLGVTGAAAERRHTLEARVAKVAELVAARPDEHVILWHDLEDERRALERAIPGLVTVYGSQDEDVRERAVMDFADGHTQRLGAKPVQFGAGVNLQRHCAWAVFCGVDFKFADFIQAVHRIYRFLQPREVVIDIVHTDTQAGVVKELQRKWAQHQELAERMRALVRQYGLAARPAQESLRRSLGVSRVEEQGAPGADGPDGRPQWTAVRNDTVDEHRARPDDSAALILTSIPFGTQYEYSPSYHDFGHTDDDQHFWRQMDHLSPHLLRTLMPGRVMAVHVKDRVRPGGMDALGFQTVSPFHADAIHHYRRHGFAYAGMITISTDVVRENNQTYRLGWTEQCKDGSRMAVGMPEYVLLFRKPPTDRTTGYADVRVTKDKREYTRGRWQVDAHALWRSSGDRLLDPDELAALPADQVYRRFRAWSANAVYDFGKHVGVSEALDARRRLPPGFQLLPVQSSRPDVWADVARMRTLNTMQAVKGKEQHLCPLPFDIVDRLITRYTNPGDLVVDPFAGLFTVPLRALQLGRRGLGVELSADYFADGVRYLRAAEEKLRAPSLFDLLAAEASADELGADSGDDAEDLAHVGDFAEGDAFAGGTADDDAAETIPERAA